MATTTRRTARRRPAPRGPEAVVKEFRRTLHRIARALPIDDLDRRLTDVEKMVGRLDKEVRKTLRKRFGVPARRPVHHEPVKAAARRPAGTAARRRRPAARTVARHRAA